MVHLHSKAPAVAGCIAAHKVCQAICLSADRASSRQLLHNLLPASALWLSELCLQTCCIMAMQAPDCHARHASNCGFNLHQRVS